MKVIFEIVENSVSQFYETESHHIKVGRDPEKSDIVLEEDGASKVHCILEYKQGRWWIVDMDSKNGTYINNQPIKRTEFYLDDIIQIGEAYLRFASSQMSVSTNQHLRRPGKKYSLNRSITLVQQKEARKEQLFDGDHHGAKEVSIVGDKGNIGKAKEAIHKRRVKKKKKVKKA